MNSNAFLARRVDLGLRPLLETQSLRAVQGATFDPVCVDEVGYYITSHHTIVWALPNFHKVLFRMLTDAQVAHDSGLPSQAQEPCTFSTVAVHTGSGKAL